MASDGLERVFEVTQVEVRAGYGKDSAVVSARGMARTGGWSDVQLREASDPHTEQVVLLELVGRPPSGFATQAITPVDTPDFEVKTPSNARTIVVKAETNDASRPIPGR
ncbi:MAG TPA: hypothetical protein VM434_20035 [Beijerinckiaceae bacterium]|jgi:hypothetical protein|nr:hypothetical protein [Beijerinckiaceae bacterium]